MYKINIETIEVTKDEEILIRFHQIDEKVLSLINKLKLGNVDTLVGTKEEHIYTLSFNDIFYIEATENKTFINLCF